MKGHGEKLSRKQEQAIIALLKEPTLAKAAQAVGVGEVTLWRWLQRPEFQGCYREARRQVVEEAIGALQRASGEAVKALRRNLTSGSPAVEVSAARAILEQAVRAVEFLDLADRVEALEKRQEERRTDERLAS